MIIPIVYLQIVIISRPARLALIQAGRHFAKAHGPLRPLVAAVFLNTALLQYRAAATLEFAAGRDQLPSGLNVPDLAASIKSRNRLGYYDTPTQIKKFWWNRRHALTPFDHGLGGNEAAGEGEFDLASAERAALGGSLPRSGSSRYPSAEGTRPGPLPCKTPHDAGETDDRSRHRRSMILEPLVLA